MSSVPPSRIVIAGAGHAGGRAAEALRVAGFSGEIVLVGNELHPPYERPPLSKDLLAGKIAVERTYLKPASYYTDSGIELRLGCEVAEIDRAAQRVRLADGGTIAYDRLLLTTGARPRRLAIPGGDSKALFYLRDIEDSLAFRAALGPGRQVAVIGAGFIGLEGAAVARQLGCAVTVLELAPAPLARVAPPALGDYYAALHRGRGVELRTGVTATRLADGDGRIHVTTGSGETLAADAVLIGIGAIPNTELAERAGLDVADGVIVDALGRTSDPAIYAAGDVTRHFNPLLGRALRLEAWQNAQNQAIAVARIMAGGDAPYAELPWFWSDQYDVNLQTVGAPERFETVLWRGRAEDGRFTLLYLAGGVPVGGATVNNARDMRFLKQLIMRGRTVDAAKFADPATKLAELCAA
jgi:NADPH-dependent 2,4-dienoyl-CoA reductase/sulfur reductase-like enzyme